MQHATYPLLLLILSPKHGKYSPSFCLFALSPKATSPYTSSYVLVLVTIHA